MNLRARANSKKPNTIFTLLSHPPDLGSVCKNPGNAAKRAKGNAKARENPNMPTSGPTSLPPVAASTSNVPMMGPVQENETSESVKAMKKIPINPPLLETLSALFTSQPGNVISNAPKNEMANTTKMTKKARLKKALVAI